MSQLHPVSAEDISQFLDELFEFDEHAKRVRSLANAALGTVSSASLAVHAIGQGLAHARVLTPKHATKQVDRLLSNQSVDVDRNFESWVLSIVGERKPIRVALDWTEFDGDGQETLALSLLTGQGRSMPLLWMTMRKEDLTRQKDSQSKRSDAEDALLCRLHDVIPPGVEVTVIADRRFGDCALLELLERELGFGDVIRIRGNHYVTAADGERRDAKDWVGKGGHASTPIWSQFTTPIHRRPRSDLQPVDCGRRCHSTTRPVRQPRHSP